MKVNDPAGQDWAPSGAQDDWPERRPAPERSIDTSSAAEARALIDRSDHARAKDLFGEIVSRQQRRAFRIAYHYLRDVAEADEAVQDAFVKSFTHIDTFKPELPFEAWFTRILINGCLDRQKTRGRRERWLLPLRELWNGVAWTSPPHASPAGTPEQLIVARERRRQIANAIGRLPDRQRTVFLLSQVDGQSAREVAAVTGLKESTVRVHLFRAVRRLRKILGDVR